MHSIDALRAEPSLYSRVPASIRRGCLSTLYCLGLLLVFDAIYSNFIYVIPEVHPARASPRVANARYHHGLAANFSGTDGWGFISHQLYTNSLGFKDASTRVVPLVGRDHRVLLMGDSFTEGIGVAFEDTFAGLLYRAGLDRATPVEFLNGSAAGYSPVLYYKRIKYLLDIGLQFDGVIVFSDISDVPDEAGDYFCFDDDPAYKGYCGSEAPKPKLKPPGFLERNFIVSDRVRRTIKSAIHDWRHPSTNMTRASHVVNAYRYGSWTLPGSTVELPPLGVEGGVARSLKNMQALADLLARSRIPLTIVVYPWPNQLLYDDRESRQVSMWREFCVRHCTQFIDLFPAFFAEKDAHQDWCDRLFIERDVHFSTEGHKIVFRELAKHLL